MASVCSSGSRRCIVKSKPDDSDNSGDGTDDGSLGNPGNDGTDDSSSGAALGINAARQVTPLSPIAEGNEAPSPSQMNDTAVTLPVFNPIVRVNSNNKSNVTADLGLISAVKQHKINKAKDLGSSTRL